MACSQVRGESVSYRLGERSIRLKKNGWFREVRRLCNNGHQTSVITTRQDLSMEEIARRMFLRWNQENFFRYMREEYSLDHPKQRTMMRSGAWPCGGFNISNYELKTQIKRIERQINALEAEIRELPDKVKIKKVLNKDKIIRLATEKKRLTDAIKMACYRAETQLYEMIGHHAAFARNLDEGRTFSQRVFQQPADIIPNHDKNQLEVRSYTHVNPPAWTACTRFSVWWKEKKTRRW